MGISSVTRALEMFWVDQELNTFQEIPVFWTTQKMTKWQSQKVTKSDLLSTILTTVSVGLFQMMILKVLTNMW